MKLAADRVDAQREAGDAAARLLRIRLRRRLIGAAALLLGAVVFVPMALQRSPKTIPDDIPIDIPGEKTPFVSRLSPVASGAVSGALKQAAASSASAAPAAAGAKSNGGSGPAQAASAPASGSAGAVQVSPAPEKHSVQSSGTEAKAAGGSSGHSGAAGAKNAAKGGIFVQAAALASSGAARELAARLSHEGFSPFIERTETHDGVRYRVRLGPYASHKQARHARARLRKLGIRANLVDAG